MPEARARLGTQHDGRAVATEKEDYVKQAVFAEKILDEASDVGHASSANDVLDLEEL